VPALWFIEITNVLVMAERKGRITPTQSDAFIADLGKLGIERDDEAPDRAFTHLLTLCRTHRLTSYDAIYLDLAVRRNLPLATLDHDLSKTAKKLGVRLLG
jgi:predicted nucleic acid-binding protein